MDGGSAMTGMASAYIAGSHQGTEPHNVEAHSVETRGYNSPGPGLEWSVLVILIANLVTKKKLVLPSTMLSSILIYNN